MLRTALLLTVALLTVVTLAAFGAPAALAASPSGVSVQDPWMRFIITTRPAAGYFTLRNDGPAAIVLTGAQSAACGMVMLHRTKEVGGVARMMPVKSVVVPANGKLTFEPGGYHLMCMSPSDAMKPGASVPVTLKFSGGDTITAEFAVKGTASEAPVK